MYSRYALATRQAPQKSVSPLRDEHWNEAGNPVHMSKLQHCNCFPLPEQFALASPCICLVQHGVLWHKNFQIQLTKSSPLSNFQKVFLRDRLSALWNLQVKNLSISGAKSIFGVFKELWRILFSCQRWKVVMISDCNVWKVLLKIFVLKSATYLSVLRNLQEKNLCISGAKPKNLTLFSCMLYIVVMNPPMQAEF